MDRVQRELEEREEEARAWAKERNVAPTLGFASRQAKKMADKVAQADAMLHMVKEASGIEEAGKAVTKRGKKISGIPTSAKKRKPGFLRKSTKKQAEDAVQEIEFDTTGSSTSLTTSIDDDASSSGADVVEFSNPVQEEAGKANSVNLAKETFDVDNKR